MRVMTVILKDLENKSDGSEVEWHNANGDPVSYRYPPPMLRHHDPDEEAKEKDESPK